MDGLPFRTLIVLHSYHHHNTAKVADVIAGILSAQIVAAQGGVASNKLDKYELIGFGSGIDSGKHYEELLEVADRLPTGAGKPSFIFSTSAIFSTNKMNADHSNLRKRLLSKGYLVLGEFSCKGFNTNFFLKFFEGMNKGRPNAEDLRHASEFAQSLKRKMTESKHELR